MILGIIFLTFNIHEYNRERRKLYRSRGQKIGVPKIKKETKEEKNEKQLSNILKYIEI